MNGTGLPFPETLDAAPGVKPLLAVAPVLPRLLDLHATASDVGLSRWTTCDLEAAGILSRVHIPLPTGELRKLLFDREDLDHLAAVWKDGAWPPPPATRLPQKPSVGLAAC